MIADNRVPRSKSLLCCTEPLTLTAKRPLQYEEPFTAKRFRSGLATPPASPEKKRNSASVPTTASPKRLVFGSQSIYSRTKALLQRSSTVSLDESHLPTRQNEYAAIMHFLSTTISSLRGNSLYITGPPGTGKTAQLDLIVREQFQSLVLGSADRVPKHEEGLANTAYFETSPGVYASVALVTINCIAVSQPAAIFAKIHQSFATQDDPTVRTMEDLQRFMQRHPNTTFVVILDEMDKLVTSTLQDTSATKTIFDLFLLAKLPHTRLALVGVANSLDMKDRFLSRLNLRRDLLPQTVSFQPYTADQMYEIVMQKLQTLDEDPVLQPMAIKFAAKKCSGNTGDLRKLFDVLRSSIEIVELEQIKKRMSRAAAADAAADAAAAADTIAPRVTLAHVAKVFSTHMNSSSTKSRISNLNMQQKMVLCSLVHRERTDIFQSQASLDDAYDYYTKLLSRKNALASLKRNEFLESCNALESCGVVNIAQGRSAGKTKHTVRLIKVNVDEREFQDEVSKTELLKRLL